MVVGETYLSLVTHNTYLTEIRKSAQRAMFLEKRREPVRNTKTFGRNEKVKVKYTNTSEVQVKKYKYVEEDLRKGNCVLIDKLENDF